MYITPHNWHYIGQPMIDRSIHVNKRGQLLFKNYCCDIFTFLSFYLSFFLSILPSFFFILKHHQTYPLHPPTQKKRWLKCLNLLISLNKRKEILIGLDLTPVFVPVRYSDLLRQETNGYLSKPKQSKKKLAQFVLPLFCITISDKYNIFMCDISKIILHEFYLSLTILQKFYKLNYHTCILKLPLTCRINFNICFVD